MTDLKTTVVGIYNATNRTNLLWWKIPFVSVVYGMMMECLHSVVGDGIDMQHRPGFCVCVLQFDLDVWRLSRNHVHPHTPTSSSPTLPQRLLPTPPHHIHATYWPRIDNVYFEYFGCSITVKYVKNLLVKFGCLDWLVPVIT